MSTALVVLNEAERIDESYALVVQEPVTPQDSALALLEEIHQKLLTITSVRDAKEVVDQADALRIYARRAISGFVAQNRCAYIKLLAQRRAGELLRELPRAPIGGAQSGRGEKHSHSYGECLDGVGISPQTAWRWERLADLAEDVIRKEWETADASGVELTEKRIHEVIHERRAAERDAADREHRDGLRRAESVRRAYDWLLRHIEVILRPGEPDYVKLKAILTDRNEIPPQDVAKLLHLFILLGERVASACKELASRIEAPMGPPFETETLTEEERAHIKEALSSTRGSWGVRTAALRVR